eukprot:3817175-Prymnesium_polylepis.1
MPQSVPMQSPCQLDPGWRTPVSLPGSRERATNTSAEHCPVRLIPHQTSVPAAPPGLMGRPATGTTSQRTPAAKLSRSTPCTERG